jgi:lipoprotein-releasing system ATP-binding protein
MLSVLDLRKAFLSPAGNRIEVLRGLSLAVNPGESVAIMGASGSGKSTLLHLLGGLDEPDHGSITLESDPSSRLGQKQIGFVFQFHYLLSDLSATENVAMPLLIRRQNTRKAFEQANSLLAELGLKERADYPVTHLSGGEQQRVAVARALISQPRLILADEPTGNLDASISEEIARTLTTYASIQSRMTVIATHNPDVARMCDRVLHLVDGRLHDSV